MANRRSNLLKGAMQHIRQKQSLYYYNKLESKYMVAPLFLAQPKPRRWFLLSSLQEYISRLLEGQSTLQWFLSAFYTVLFSVKIQFQVSGGSASGGWLCMLDIVPLYLFISKYEFTALLCWKTKPLPIIPSILKLSSTTGWNVTPKPPPTSSRHIHNVLNQ